MIEDQAKVDEIFEYAQLRDNISFIDSITAIAFFDKTTDTFHAFKKDSHARICACGVLETERKVGGLHLGVIFKHHKAPAPCMLTAILPSTIDFSRKHFSELLPLFKQLVEVQEFNLEEVETFPEMLSFLKLALEIFLIYPSANREEFNDFDPLQVLNFSAGSKVQDFKEKVIAKIKTDFKDEAQHFVTTDTGESVENEELHVVFMTGSSFVNYGREARKRAHANLTEGTYYDFNEELDSFVKVFLRSIFLTDNVFLNSYRGIVMLLSSAEMGALADAEFNILRSVPMPADRQLFETLLGLNQDKFPDLFYAPPSEKMDSIDSWIEESTATHKALA